MPNDQLLRNSSKQCIAVLTGKEKSVINLFFVRDADITFFDQMKQPMMMYRLDLYKSYLLPFPIRKPEPPNK